MILVNQRDHITWYDGMTITDLLERMNYTFPHIIVSIDGVIVPPDTYESQTLPDEADVRVIHLMAGG
jgi:sulfur carrier protein